MPTSSFGARVRTRSGRAIPVGLRGHARRAASAISGILGGSTRCFEAEERMRISAGDQGSSVNGVSLCPVQCCAIASRGTKARLFRQGVRYGEAQVRLERLHRGFGCRSIKPGSSALLAVKVCGRLIASSHSDRGSMEFLLGRHVGAIGALARRQVTEVRSSAPATQLDGIPAVVVHWREPGRCRATVESIIVQEGVGPILVVDNDSSLGDIDMPAGVHVSPVSGTPGTWAAPTLDWHDGSPPTPSSCW